MDDPLSDPLAFYSVLLPKLRAPRVGFNISSDNRWTALLSNSNVPLFMPWFVLLLICEALICTCGVVLESDDKHEWRRLEILEFWYFAIYCVWWVFIQCFLERAFDLYCELQAPNVLRRLLLGRRLGFYRVLYLLVFTFKWVYHVAGLQDTFKRTFNHMYPFPKCTWWDYWVIQ